MFQATGYKRRYQVCFFDVPSIVDNSEASTDFFEALAETDSISLFSHMTIQIIIDKAWREHRNFFKVFFEIPYIILVLAYFLWSVFCNVSDSLPSIFKSPEDKAKVGYYICVSLIGPLAMYFFL